MVFNILIDNTDDHERNHALLAMQPGAAGPMRLAPAYDVLPSNSGQGAQEFVCGAAGRDSTLDNAMSRCDAFGLSRDEAAVEVGAVIAVVEGWKPHFLGTGVSRRDIDTLAEWIDGDALHAQRRGFDAARASAPGPRRKTISPFGRR
jgi:serine/threonine-protein kinase HipA